MPDTAPSLYDRGWSERVGEHGSSVRVFERYPDSNLYVEFQREAEGQVKFRRSLGHKNRELAVQQAERIARAREITNDPDRAMAIADELASVGRQGAALDLAIRILRAVARRMERRHELTTAALMSDAADRLESWAENAKAA